MGPRRVRTSTQVSPLGSFHRTILTSTFQHNYMTDLADGQTVRRAEFTFFLFTALFAAQSTEPGTREYPVKHSLNA